MRAALFVSVVVVIGIVSCEPSTALRAKIQARLAELKAKRSPAERQGSSPEPIPPETMEFLSLLGDCEVNRRVQQLLGEDQCGEGILKAACPVIMDIAIGLWRAAAKTTPSDDETTPSDDVREVSRLADVELMAMAVIKKHMPVFVCSNLKAERENIAFLVNQAGEDRETDTYLRSSKAFADDCNAVLGIFEKEFIVDLGELRDALASIGDR